MQHLWALLYPLRSFLGWLVCTGGPSGLDFPRAAAASCPPGLRAALLSLQMAMLLKLQEAANYIESPDRETMVDPDLQSTL